MNICVFCGSSSGNDAVYLNATKELGAWLVKTNSTLIYGGAKIGLMGILAEEVMDQGGTVVGVIPEFLMKLEVGHTGITRLEMVSTMHERKRKMAEMADVFIAMPGGWGTLDELAEILTWKQLKLVNEPIGLLNTNSFFDPLLTQMKRMTDDGFLEAESLAEIKVAKKPHELLTLLGVNRP
jgi:uncharacterized protein (TIGR00730 family)